MPAVRSRGLSSDCKRAATGLATAAGLAITIIDLIAEMAEGLLLSLPTDFGASVWVVLAAGSLTATTTDLLEASLPGEGLLSVLTVVLLDTALLAPVPPDIVLPDVVLAETLVEAGFFALAAGIAGAAGSRETAL